MNFRDVYQCGSSEAMFSPYNSEIEVTLIILFWQIQSISSWNYMVLLFAHNGNFISVIPIWLNSEEQI